MIKDTKYIKIFPIILIIGIIPLIVRLKKVSYPYFDFVWSANNKIGYDIFAYYKSIVLIFIGALLLIRLMYLYLNHKIDFQNKYIIILLSSAFFILLSYAFSDHQVVASFGYKDRYEGTYVLLSYIIFSLYILIEYKSCQEIDLTLKYSLLFISIVALIGLGQYFKVDIFQYDFGKLILASKDMVSNLVYKSQVGRVYMTLYNPNYVGTYFVLIGPLIANYFINAKKKTLQLVYLLLYTALAFSLAGSQSRGGFIGGLFALLILSLFNLIYNRNLNLKTKKIRISIIVIIFLFIFLNHGNNMNRVNAMFADDDTKIPLEDVYTFQDEIYINYNNTGYFIKDESEGIVLYKGELKDYSNKEIILEVKVEELPDWMDIKEVLRSEDENTFIVTIEEKLRLPFGNVKQGMKYINSRAYYTDLKKIPAIKTYQRESVGSGRIYIWSRSIPLLKETFFIGNGADTYALVFPQTDYIGKFKGFGDYKRLDETIVDKPHNLYLQIGINTGIISLILYLLINFFLIFDLFSVIKSGHQLTKGIAFISIIMCYGVTMLFNDSTVVVSGIYWSIIGFSMALVNLVKAKNPMIYKS